MGSFGQIDGWFLTSEDKSGFGNPCTLSAGEYKLTTCKMDDIPISLHGAWCLFLINDAYKQRYMLIIAFG